MVNRIRMGVINFSAKGQIFLFPSLLQLYVPFLSRLALKVGVSSLTLTLLV